MSQASTKRRRKPRKAPASRADHLKGHRFPKGRSGNPGGRPKGLHREIRKLLPLAEQAELVVAAAQALDSKVLLALMDREWPKPDAKTIAEALRDAAQKIHPAASLPAPGTAQEIAAVLDRQGALEDPDAAESGQVH